MTDPNGAPRPDPYTAPPIPPAYSPQGGSTGGGSTGTLAPPPGADYPGKTLGIVGLVLAFLFNLAGLVCSIIAYSQSRRAGYKNGIALAGIIVSASFMVLSVIAAIAVIALVAALRSSGATGY